jgi:hypothetical protein
MSLEKVKAEAVAFFSEAIIKWNDLVGLFIAVRDARYAPADDDIKRANSILHWFQDNYLSYKKYSRFLVVRNLPNGKTIRVDPIFSVIF